MSIKTAAEMFGDGGGFGAAVPYDTSNPPGTGAGNRGIQFGEQLTASIANRPHYALALNDEDLNARLADFETQGLDAAYDLGTLGPAGGGRTVTKDAGAIETTSGHGAVTGDAEDDRSHFRANSLSDTAGSSIGFEFKGKRSAANGQSGFDPIAGFLDRQVLAKSTGDTVLVHGAAATLNPGGAVVTTVRLGSGTFHSSGSTDLALNHDLLEIASTNHSGLYVITGLGANDDDVTVAQIDGAAPSFTADEVATISVYRVRFGSMGNFTTRTAMKSTVMSALQAADSVLDLLPGKSESAETLGASSGLRVLKREGDGSVSSAWSIDFFGRTQHTLVRGSIAINKDKNTWGGDYASLKDFVDPGMGHIVAAGVDEIGSTEAYAGFLSLREITASGGVVAGVTAMTFTANSPTQGEVLFSSALASETDFITSIAPLGSYVEITGSAGGGLYDGLYMILQLNETGNGGFLLANVDQTTPAHFPTSGTFTIGRIFAGSVLGHNRSLSVADNLGGANTKVQNVLSGSGETDSTALGFTNHGLGTTYFMRGYKSDDAVSGNTKETYYVKSNGESRSRYGYIAGVGAETGVGFAIGTTDESADFYFLSPRPRHIWIPAEKLLWSHNGTPTMPVYPATNGSSPNLESFLATQANRAEGMLALNKLLPQDATVTEVGIVVKPGAARATSDNRMGIRLFTHEINPTTYAISSPTNTVITRDDGTTNWQAITLSGLTEQIRNDFIVTGGNARVVKVFVTSGNDSATNEDWFLGMFIKHTDPGPRNY